MEKIKLGIVPIKRSFLPMETAKTQKEEFMAVIENIRDEYVEIIDINDICENGIAFEYDNISSVVEKFRKHNIDAIFFPFCDFGEESVVAGIAKNFEVPVLVWGPRDKRPNTDKQIGTDTQCGIIAATKVLTRCGIKFSYILNSYVDSVQFKNGYETFLRVCMVTKTMKNMRIAQIGNRPQPFMSVIANEGSLLEKFGINIIPISLNAIVDLTEKIISDNSEVFQKYFADINSRIDCSAMDEDKVKRVAGIKMAMQEVIDKEDCIAASMECWTAYDLLKGLPCFAIGELIDDGIPVSCEGDINGAVTLAIMKACTLGDTKQFFADFTIRHPQNDNAELLWHCGPFPYSMKHDTAKARMVDCMGRWELKEGDITLCRFDEINGQYSLFAGEGHTTSGPETTGTYVWFETENWEQWEEMLIFGPYIHHTGGMYGKYIPALREVARYLDIKFDTVGMDGPRSLR